jgi:hypothetical protein
VLPFVLIGLVDNVLTFVVFPLKVKLTLAKEVIDAILLPLAHRVEDWGLTIIVYVVGVATLLDQHLHDISVALSRRVKDRRLAIAVHMVSFAPMLEK